MNSEPTRRRGAILNACCAVVLFAGMTAQSGVYAQEPQSAVPDTSRVDTTSVGDSTVAGDSVSAGAPAEPAIIEHGAPLGSVLSEGGLKGTPYITNLDMAWMRYFTAFDVLKWSLPAAPLSQGAPGLLRTFSYAGASPASLSTLFNGRPMRGVRNGGYDLELYPMEFVERIEVLRGARAALYGSGESLLAFNFVQPRFDVDGSYVRLWYAQSEHNLTGADITYARNVSNRTNLSLGFRRMPSDGEFPNQALSGWSARGSFRWHVDDGLTLSLTEIFSDHGRGANGGLTQPSSRNSLLATVVNPDLEEDMLRHDATLSARWYPRRSEEIDTLFGTRSEVVDTTVRLDGSLYYTYARRTLTTEDDALVCRDRRDLLGARAGLMLPLSFARLEANGIIEIGKKGEPRLEAGGLLEIPVADLVSGGGGLRLFSDNGERYTLLFAELALAPMDSLLLRGTLRQRIDIESGAVVRLPTELSDSLVLFSDHITRLLAEGSMEWHDGIWRAGVSAYVRQAEPVEGGTSSTSQTIPGGEVHLRLPLLWSLAVDNRIHLMHDPEGNGRFPVAQGKSDLYGRWNLFNGNLDLQVGTSLEYQSGMRGAEFMSGSAAYCTDAGAFIVPDTANRSLFTPFPIWDGYIQARIGTAFIRLALQNILDVEFYSLYRYPRWAREFNLMVTWALVD